MCHCLVVPTWYVNLFLCCRPTVSRTTSVWVWSCSVVRTYALYCISAWIKYGGHGINMRVGSLNACLSCRVTQFVCFIKLSHWHTPPYQCSKLSSHIYTFIVAEALTSSVLQCPWASHSFAVSWQTHLAGSIYYNEACYRHVYYFLLSRSLLPVTSWFSQCQDIHSAIIAMPSYNVTSCTYA